MRIVYDKLAELEEVAEKIIKFAQEDKIWLFEGVMGVGKTTLIKAIGRVMGVMDTIQSPTYSIVNEYHTQTDTIIYHFDFYRIKDESEAMDIGYEEYFFDQHFCFIEWPSKIPTLIPEKHLEIKLSIANNSHIIELTRHE